jgi:ubiquinone biosynthesis protein COQ4
MKNDPPRYEIPKRDWPRAFRVIRRVIENPERTDDIIEIINALAGPSFEKAYQRFYKSPSGQKLLADQPDLFATLSDREALQQLPEGSFGQVYADFMQRGGISPAGLMEADEIARERLDRPDDIEIDPHREFFGTRLRDQHDLWHVLSGYGMDEAGEAANLAFSVSQFPNPGMAFIAMASVFVQPNLKTATWGRYLFQAWRRGRTLAKTLPQVPYEELLPLPLEEVRQRLGIPEPAAFHPTGIAILKGSKGNAGMGEVVWGFPSRPAVATTA